MKKKDSKKKDTKDKESKKKVSKVDKGEKATQNIEPIYKPPQNNAPHFPYQTPQNADPKLQFPDVNPQDPYQPPYQSSDSVDITNYPSVNPNTIPQDYNLYQDNNLYQNTDPYSAPQFYPPQNPQFIPPQSPQFVPPPNPQFVPQVPQFVPPQNPQFIPTQNPQFIPSQNPQFIPPQNPQFIPSQTPQFIPLQNQQLNQPQVPQPNQPQMVKNTQKPQPANPHYKGKKQQQNHHLTDEERAMKSIADENRDIVKSKKYKISKSETMTEVYHNQVMFRLEQRPPKNQKSLILVNNFSTINTAITLHNKNKGDNICILSFADPFKPGGAYLKGRGLQEETICRQTLLYPTLCESNMYTIHRENNKSLIDFDNMIYSPDVHVIRDDNYKLLKKKSFTINVISSSAIDNRLGIPNAASIMERRIRRIISLAAEKGNDVLILGAFGCGGYKNDPAVVSQIFKKVLVTDGFKNYFKLVVFPIYKNDKCFTIFINAFKGC